jgi:hypothetical protein
MVRTLDILPSSFSTSPLPSDRRDGGAEGASRLETDGGHHYFRAHICCRDLPSGVKQSVWSCSIYVGFGLQTARCGVSRDPNIVCWHSNKLGFLLCQ